MVRNAEQTATTAEARTSNPPGYCLQWSRECASIAALYPDAATAWRYAIHRHKGDRNVPRGAMAYWVGGSSGYGHIAVGFGNGRVRSTDAGGAGNVATVDVGWFDKHWPSITYVGWADNVNDVIIPGVGDEMNEQDWQRMESLVRSVWADQMTVTQPGSGQDVQKSRQQVLRELWQKVTKAT
jgi:hypothetical protein